MLKAISRMALCILCEYWILVPSLNTVQCEHACLGENIYQSFNVQYKVLEPIANGGIGDQPMIVNWQMVKKGNLQVGWRYAVGESKCLWQRVTAYPPYI